MSGLNWATLGPGWDFPVTEFSNFITLFSFRGICKRKQGPFCHIFSIPLFWYVSAVSCRVTQSVLSTNQGTFNICSLRFFIPFPLLVSINRIKPIGSSWVIFCRECKVGRTLMTSLAFVNFCCCFFMQDFLVIVMLSMSIFASCSSGATTCKCLEEEDATTAPTQVGYWVSNFHSASEFFRNSLLCYTNV